jgi:hypothetical protein
MLSFVYHMGIWRALCQQIGRSSRHAVPLVRTIMKRIWFWFRCADREQSHACGGGVFHGQPAHRLPRAPGRGGGKGRFCAQVRKTKSIMDETGHGPILHHEENEVLTGSLITYVIGDKGR